MNSPILILILFLFFVIIGIQNRNKLSMNLIAFLLPFQTLFFKFFGLNIIAILGFFVGQFIRDKRGNISLYYSVPSGKYVTMIILLIIGGIFNSYISNLSELEWFSASVLVTQGQFLAYNLGAIILFGLIVFYVRTKEDILDMLFYFSLSSMYTIVSWVGFFYMGNDMPSFIRSVNDGGGGIRFSGLWGDYELFVEYGLMVLVFLIAVLLLKPSKIYKRLSVFCMILILPMVTSTGTRSFIITGIIIGSLFLLFTMFNRDIALGKRMKFLMFFSLFATLAIVMVMSSDLLVQRFSETIDNYQLYTSYRSLSTFEMMLNRQYSTTYETILRVGGVFGKGSFFVHQIGSDTMVYHCLYYQLVVNFGVLGLIVFLMFFYDLLKRLFKVYAVKKSQLAMLLFILITVLLIDQIKINFMRLSPHILNYWFLFGLANSMIKYKIED